MEHKEFVAELRRGWRYRFWEVALWLPLTLQSWYLRMKYRERATASPADTMIAGSAAATARLPKSDSANRAVTQTQIPYVP